MKSQNMELVDRLPASTLTPAGDQINGMPVMIAGFVFVSFRRVTISVLNMSHDILE